jgi:protein involved in sex pheromone biosynthesis
MVDRFCGFSRCVIAALVLLLAGCQPERVTRANFERIQKGMKREEVEAILGKPEHSYQGVLSWSTNHSRTVISVVLDDQGRVDDMSSDNL